MKRRFVVTSEAKADLREILFDIAEDSPDTAVAEECNPSYLGKRRPIMTKATISSKGQIAIPKAVRERLNLKAGTEVMIDVQGETLVMKRMVRNYPDWHTMRGMAGGGESLTEALTKERAAEVAHDNARTNQGR